MANLIYEERRMPRVGDVCAIDFKYITPVNLYLDEFQWDRSDNIKFYPCDSDKRNLSNDGEITFIKYLGNGMFIDLVSDQLLIGSLINTDDFGSEEYDALDERSKEEVDIINKFWWSIFSPTNKDDFFKSLSIFKENPLAISICDSPFMSINADVAKKFGSQNMDQVKSKITNAKLTAQQELNQRYNELQGILGPYLESINNNEEISYDPIKK